MGIIKAICTSPDKGMRKKNIGQGQLIQEHGLCGDAHAGDWHRQVSLLAVESIDKMRALGLDVGPGDFAENLTTEGIDLVSLPLGTRLKIGGEAIGEVTQIGKECHDHCAIYYQAGDCVMPREGIFVRILLGGEIKVGDPINVYEKKCYKKVVKDVSLLEVSSEILEAVEKASKEKVLTCTEARKLAEELKVSPKLIGDAADKLKIKIRVCELGCF